jgi:hypothetical protein
MDWIDLARDMGTWRYIVHAAMNLLVPQYAGDFWTSWDPVSFSRILIQVVSYSLTYLLSQ